MIIRTATPEDIPALRELYLELEKDGVRYQPEHFVIGSRTDDFFQNIFDSPTQDILVADEYLGFSGTHCDHMVITEPYKTKFFEGLRNAVLAHGNKIVFNDTYVMYLAKKPNSRNLFN